MSLWVKICGILRMEDAQAAVDAGADAIGLNFAAGSPRRISPTKARPIADVMRGSVEIVGVFVNSSPEEIEAIDNEVGLDGFQLHGDEPPELIARWPGKAFKAFRIGGPEDLELLDRYPGNRYLLDARVPGAYGGTGARFDWTLARAAARSTPIVIAGGLRPENVAEAISIARPNGVDTASGVETAPGEKDPERVAAFVAAARAAARTR